MAVSAKAWVEVAPDQARHHPLYGFGGWNWLLALWWLIQSASAVVVLLLAPNPLAVGLLAFLAALAATLLLKMSLFRPLFFLYTALDFGVALVARVPSLVSAEAVVPGGGMPPLMLMTVLLAVYVGQSARINVTLCHRVREDDPFLYKLPA